MPFTVANFHPDHAPEFPAHVRSVVRENAMWDRPIFKAPPLDRFLHGLDFKRVAQELRAVGLINR